MNQLPPVDLPEFGTQIIIGLISLIIGLAVAWSYHRWAVVREREAARREDLRYWNDRLGQLVREIGDEPATIGGKEIRKGFLLNLVDNDTEPPFRAVDHRQTEMIMAARYALQRIRTLEAELGLPRTNSVNPSNFPKSYRNWLITFIAVLLVACGRPPDWEILATADAIRSRIPPPTATLPPTQSEYIPDVHEYRQTEAAAEREIIKEWNNRDAMEQAALADYEATRWAEMKTSTADVWREICAYTNTDANLHTGPSPDYSIKAVAPANTCITIIWGKNSDGTWYSILADEEINDGDFWYPGEVWIAASLVERAGTDLKILDPEGTPAPPTATSPYPSMKGPDVQAPNFQEETSRSCSGGCKEFPNWCAPPIKGNISFTEPKIVF